MSFEALSQQSLPEADLSQKLSAALAIIDNQRRKIQRLEQLASRDALTGLLNRRALQHVFSRERSLALRQNRGDGWAIFLDINDFKKLNDSHGHALGDYCLLSLAHELKQFSRETDYVFRLGGDEFLILLPRIGQTGFGHRLDDLSTALQPLRFNWRGQDFSVKVSYGLVRYSIEHTLEQLLHQADLAMYRQKDRAQQANLQMPLPLTLV